MSTIAQGYFHSAVCCRRPSTLRWYSGYAQVKVLADRKRLLLLILWHVPVAGRSKQHRTSSVDAVEFHFRQIYYAVACAANFKSWIDRMQSILDKNSGHTSHFISRAFAGCTQRRARILPLPAFFRLRLSLPVPPRPLRPLARSKRASRSPSNTTAKHTQSAEAFFVLMPKTASSRKRERRARSRNVQCKQ